MNIKILKDDAIFKGLNNRYNRFINSSIQGIRKKVMIIGINVLIILILTHFSDNLLIMTLCILGCGASVVGGLLYLIRQYE